MTKITVMTGALAVALMFAIPQVVSAQKGCPKGVNQNVNVGQSANAIAGGNKNKIASNIGTVDCKKLRGPINQNVNVGKSSNVIRGGSKNKIKSNIGTVK